MDVTRLSERERREVVPGYHGIFVHSETMTLAHWEVEAGAVLPEHSHPHEQVLMVIEGRFEVTMGAESRVIGAGTDVVIPSNVPHAGRAITACRLIDAFHPVRETYRSTPP